MVTDEQNNIVVDYIQNAASNTPVFDGQTSEQGLESMYANTGIPESIWENWFQCLAFLQCMAQNGINFGVLPSTSQRNFQCFTTNNSPITYIIIDCTR